MKKSVLIWLAVVLFAGSAAEAQNRSKRTQATERSQRQSADDLNLTPEQAQHMRSINEEFRTKSAAIRNDSRLTRQQQNAQLETLRNETRAKRMALLTATQREKFESLEKKHGKAYAYGDWKEDGVKRGKRLGADKGAKKGWEKNNGPFRDVKKNGTYNKRGKDRFEYSSRSGKAGTRK